MPASFPELLNSRLFKFIVGEAVDGSPTEFFVHEEAIAQLSEPLNNLTKGGLTESQAGCTIWDDVSQETFERFAQFAYTGDYSVPKGEKRSKPANRQRKVSNESLPTTSNGVQRWDKAEQYDKPAEVPPPRNNKSWEPAQPTINDYDWGFSSKKSKKKKSVFSFDMGAEEGFERQPELISSTKRDKYPERHSPVHSIEFRSLSFPIIAPRNNHEGTCEPDKHYDPDLNYSNLFLSHASLYLLGDYRLIDSLKALALCKLHKTLCVFQLDDSNAEDVIDLARYAYSEEGGEGRLDGGIGALRSLVCQYMATNAMVLSFDAGFMDLLGDGGQFVKDFFKFEVQRTS